jgi:hypothetical protein
MAHVMHDLETMGKRPGDVIASIGAVVFDPYGTALGATFSMNIDEASCVAAGLITHPGTVEWWQAPERAEAYAALKVDPRPLGEVLDAFDAWWAEVDGHRIWSQGKHFDSPILAAAYHALGRSEPWKYNALRDTRTAYDMGDVVVVNHKGVHHIALDDAITQAGDVQLAYRNLWLDRIAGRSRMETNLDILAEIVQRVNDEAFALDGPQGERLNLIARDIDALLPTGKRVWP